MVLSVALLGPNPTAWAGEERLRVATEGAYPPFNFIDERGQLAGFDVDIAGALCDVLKKECEMMAVPWEQLLSRLAAGDFEVIVASMAKTPERAQLAEFTDVYYRTPHAFIGRADDGIREVTPATVHGKVLAAQRDTIQADYLRQHYQNSAVVRLTDTMPAAFELLAGGAIDYVLADCLCLLIPSSAPTPGRVLKSSARRSPTKSCRRSPTFRFAKAIWGFATPSTGL
jgi:polar amino acid transport system substrate-binding protein